MARIYPQVGDLVVEGCQQHPRPPLEKCSLIFSAVDMDKGCS